MKKSWRRRRAPRRQVAPAGPGPAGGSQGRGGGTRRRTRRRRPGRRRGARPAPPPGIDEIKISSNENPLGPGKHVLDAIIGKFPEAGRYPFNSTPNDTKLVEVIAAAAQSQARERRPWRRLAGNPEDVDAGVHVAVPAPGHRLADVRELHGHRAASRHPVYAKSKSIRSCGSISRACSTVARGAGLIFVNNPNNPTATVHGAKAIADFVERVRRISPDTVILIDEAYHEYVTDPEYATAIPLALATPNVFVARTFSKAYGMAGMRIGYAIGQPDTIKPLARLKMPYNISVFGIAAGLAALGNPQHIAAERTRNTEVRTFTTKFFEELGCKAAVSQGNFLFVDIGRPAAEFRDGVRRPMGGRRPRLPALRTHHARISLGTMAEMQSAPRRVSRRAATRGRCGARRRRTLGSGEQ